MDAVLGRDYPEGLAHCRLLREFGGELRGNCASAASEVKELDGRASSTARQSGQFLRKAGRFLGGRVITHSTGHLYKTPTIGHV